MVLAHLKTWRYSIKIGVAFVLAATLSACSLGPQSTRQAMVTIDESTPSCAS